MDHTGSDGDRFTRQNQLLWQLAMAQRQNPGSLLQEDLQPLIQAAAAFLDVERVSVWMLGNKYRELTCLAMYDGREIAVSSVAALQARDYPRYFKAILEERFIDAADAWQDPRTAEFAPNYLAAHGIGAMLDAPIFFGAEPRGILCLEKRGGPRPWSDADRAFAASIADLAGSEFAEAGRKAGEQELRRSEALYRSVVEDQTDYIVRAERGGRLVFANNSLVELLQLDREHLHECSIYDYVPPADHAVIRDAALHLSRETPVARYTHRVELPDGELRTVDWTLRGFFDEQGQISGYQAIGRDVTDEMQQQVRMRESRRLEALAVMAGGMAHDFNNLLTPILNFTDLAQTALPPESKVRDYLQYVMKSALRARDLIRMVLIFSKREEQKARRPLQAGKLVREVMSFLRSTSPSRIRIIEDVDVEAGVIRANPSDLFQMLSNLCNNAIYAMPAGGNLRVSCNQVLRRGDLMLQLEVVDEGCGMTAEEQARIFDPFFTTKPVGQGTGLGLSVVLGLVEELGGEIACKSAPGKGSAFVMYFPVLDAVEPEQSTTQLPHAVLKGTEHIFVVDDEVHITAAVTSGLEHLGYSVTARTSPNEALALLARPGDRHELAIVDYTMPYMTGIELCRQLKRSRPTLPVLLISGYAELIDVAEWRDAGVAACLEKPFSLEELAVVLRQVLDASRIG